MGRVDPAKCSPLEVHDDLQHVNIVKLIQAINFFRKEGEIFHFINHFISFTTSLYSI
jgi:hypothetical protein